MKFENYYHNEINHNITDYYECKAETRISDIRITQAEYNFTNGEHFFVTHAVLSGSCNKFGGLGFKKIKSSESQTREEATAECWKKINRFLQKNEGYEVEVE